jgi:hypothetical protein
MNEIAHEGLGLLWQDAARTAFFFLSIDVGKKFKGL